MKGGRGQDGKGGGQCWGGGGVEREERGTMLESGEERKKGVAIIVWLRNLPPGV